jgi:RNA polymerase sigma factor for flagellar operon FliA
MREIGLALDLSESRVSQMHTSILKRLKARLGEQQQELELRE